MQPTLPWKLDLVFISFSCICFCASLRLKDWKSKSSSKDDGDTGDSCMLWDDEAMFTKQRAPTLKNNIYLNPLIMATIETSLNLQQQQKKSSMLQQTLNLKQFDG